ncbi:hypothetical protein J437_LFUL003768, partial [Ladona fulva]
MELDSLLIQVQGALISLKRNHGLQRNQSGKNIKDSAFYQALERIRNTCNHSERDMRRIHLYLLLNSDFKFNESLIEDENLSHIVSTTPTVDKYLLVETFLMLKFEKYINETILFGHPSIGVEYLDAIYTVLETQRFVHFIPFVEYFIAVIHRKLSLLSSDDSRCEYGLEIRRSFSYYYEQLLTIFSPPHDKYKMGYVVKSLLSLLSSFLDHCYNFPIPDDSDHSLYVMTLSYIQPDTSNAAIIDFNKKEDIRHILSMLKSNLLLVNLTMWMDWFEMKWKSTNRESTTENMQQVIGELAYLCKEKLHNISLDFPEVEVIITVLTSMAIKPYNEDEEIQKTENLVEILQKVRDGSLQPMSRKKWLIAMLSIPKSLTENDCFKCVEEFGSYLNDCEELLLLLERVAELITNKPTLHSADSENYSNEVEKIKRTLLKIFSQVSLEDQGKIMALYFAKYGLSHLFATKDYDKIITEYLNKVVNSSEGGGHVFQVQKCAILQQDEIFQEMLLPNLKEFLENKSWNSVDLCIKTIYELITRSTVNYQNPVVLLAVLLQVMEIGRQEMREEFSSSAASTCELLASYLPQIAEKFIGGNLIDGKSLEWLKARISCSFPLSKIYFSCLLDGDDIYKSIQKILMLLFFQSTEVGEINLLELLRNQPKILCYSLFKLLPSCTTS